MINEHIVILKNDAIGDLPPSLKAIKNISDDKNVKKITIFMSNLNEKFSFLVKNDKTQIKKINYNLKIIDKVKLLYFFFTNKIDKAIILVPKQFYFFLPFIFFNTNFYGICVNNINKYKRPSEFLRKYLFKYEINDRSAIFKRESIENLQIKLTNRTVQNSKNIIINIKVNDNLRKYLPKKYIYFHVRNQRINELGWGNNDLEKLFNEFLNHCDSLVITKDISLGNKYKENLANTKFLLENYNSFNLKTYKYINNKSRVLLLDNIEGEDLYNVIYKSKKTIGFHGMVTQLASIEKKPVLDLFHCNIKNWNDYRNYRNSFYEFKPIYNEYDFIIPARNINKTIKKMRFFLKK